MKTELPIWVMPTIALVGLIVMVVAIWQAMMGFNRPVGKDIEVKPGQYNLREEMQKPRNPNKRGHTNGATTNPSGGSL